MERLTVEQRYARGESLEDIANDISAESVAILKANLVFPEGMAAGYVICRMQGGVHKGTCPMCGCEPITQPIS